jgi:hypothetical protein
VGIRYWIGGVQLGERGMISQADFWKPQPYDFEAIVACVNVETLIEPHRRRAGKHGFTDTKWRTEWNAMEPHHDKYDRSHFDQTGISTALDVWDNRRKVAK